MNEPRMPHGMPIPPSVGSNDGPVLLDPDANLTAQLETANAILAVNANPDGCAHEDIAYHAIGLAESVLALDAHLAAGGLPPKRWTGTATEKRGSKMQAEIDSLVDQLRTSREEVLRISSTAVRTLGVLRDLFDTEREFADLDAELAASKQAGHEGGPPDSLVEEHGNAMWKRDTVRGAACRLLAEWEGKTL